MNYIGKRIYFNKEDGSIILDTGERCGAVVPTTVEEDLAFYDVLQNVERESLNYIELSYGEHQEEFATCTHYEIDVEANELIFHF